MTDQHNTDWRAAGYMTREAYETASLVSENAALRELNLELVKALTDVTHELDSAYSYFLRSGPDCDPFGDVDPTLDAANAVLKHAEEVLK